MAKKIDGVCRLCGKTTKLSFEHVPPQSVFNNQPVKQYDGNEVLKRIPDFEDGKIRYKNMQRGSGGFFLCESCNSYTGTKYNTVFKEVAGDIGNLILQNATNDTTGICVETKPIKWNRFFKQVMTMFIDVSDLCINDNELKTYILDENSTKFNSDKYKVFCYATNFKNYKSSKIIGRLEIDTFDLLGAEISAFPLGFLLLIDEKKKLHQRTDLDEFSYIGLDITDFATFGCDREYKIDATIPLHRIDNYDSILEVMNIYREQAFVKDLIEKGIIQL